MLSPNEYNINVTHNVTCCKVYIRYEDGIGMEWEITGGSGRMNEHGSEEK